jgi:PIN domain nuclease of toxin-antitoxin system
MMLLDTCTLLWWTLEPDQLSGIAANEIQRAEKLVISSISIWEIGIKIKRSKLKIPLTLDDYVARLKRVGNINIIAVDETIWIKNLQLDWTHKDPADRTIVATAEIHSLPIVTPDRIIIEFYPRTIW